MSSDSDSAPPKDKKAKKPKKRDIPHLSESEDSEEEKRILQKSKKRKAAAVDPDDETTKKEAKPAKSAKKAETPSNPEWTLSSNSRGSRKVSVETWNNSILVSIREFYDDNGTLKPGKKGISLTMDQFKKLKEVWEDLCQAVEEKSS